MKVDLVRWWRRCAVSWALVAAIIVGIGAMVPEDGYAGGTIKVDDDKWISIGMGIKTSFNAVEGASPAGHYTNDFKVDFARIYINGKIHKYVGFEFNTECFNCGVAGGANIFGGNSAIGLLDAIGKFEFDEKFNIWVGRLLLPSERGELNGPFYHATYAGFRTPFFPADFSSNFDNGAGLYGRDNGATLWGKVHPMGTHLLYAVSVSQGLRAAANSGSSLMYTGRLQWNLLNDETSPGYYTSGTYFGTAGDILAIAISGQHQKDGAGNVNAAFGVSDFTGMSIDLLVEKVLPNNWGVFTFNGEFKRFWARYALDAFTAVSPVTGLVDCFCIFNGHSWTVYGLYLIPAKVGIGQFQPYARFTSINPLNSSTRQEWEGGVNYVIDGFNARISAYYTYGDLKTKGGPAGSFSPTATGDKVDSFHVALQLQY
ncbi:Short chain amide porin [Candidatus Nitrospira inopinata]|uniref:Short chain amide porin n=2 Tax=Candidatus Nitrospira inopinata TaxID=1715989 RepID=A0A0S4KWX2_9BACT|nr:Short chain amide porin [Candidatus Nitrospira inopinata]